MDFLNTLEKEFNIKLNSQQKSAVLHKDGPAIILAVPGAGKTTTLISRTANLIMNHHIKPENILSITFSKASANDMKHRFAKMFGHIVNENIHFSTIHSFAYTVIRHYCSSNYSQIPNIIEGEDSPVSKASLLKGIYFEINREYASEDRLEELSNVIGYMKNMMMDFDGENEFDIPNLSQIIKKYEAVKKQNKWMDYDDMLVYAFNILKQYKPILEYMREKYKYIQVDEGQDTSKIQHEIIKIISYPQNNIFLVADDDQSIYGFRGAYPKFLLEFQKVYPNAKVYYMEENYRSTKSIVKTANEFIKRNTQRYVKNIVTNNDTGSQINILNFKNEGEQYKYILEQIENSENFSDTAILFRNNISSIPLVDILDKNNISFYVREKKLNFFTHWITQDILAFMQLALNSSDIAAFEKIYYKMNLYISKDMFNALKNNYEILRKSIFDVLLSNSQLNRGQKENIFRVKGFLEQIPRNKPAKIFEIIENYINYRDYIEQNAKKNGCSLETANNIISVLKSIASGLDTIYDFMDRLQDLKNIIEEGSKIRGRDAVVLTTIHSAKGLEFEKVIMFDLIEGQFPTYYSIEQHEKGKIAELEEERRLFYVGITRGKKEVSLISLNTKNEERVEVSRFVKEVDVIINGERETKIRSLINKNDYIVHNHFGKGRIIDIAEDIMEVVFSGGLRKSLSIDMCIKNKLIKIS